MAEGRIGVLISGSGTNLQAIIDGCANGSIPGEVSAVISDNPDAYGLERAKKAGIPAIAVLRSDFDKKWQYEVEICRVLKKYGVELVCLAGYMRIAGKSFLKRYGGRTLNIHPALLPSFPGLHGQQQAFEHGVKVAGCTVHFVNQGVDEGPIIVQKCVPVLEEDSVETLSARILEQEHQAYPEAIRLYFEGKLTIEGRRVRISE
jgi:phosphoribosylglycinamide formyltransferase-1